MRRIIYNTLIFSLFVFSFFCNYPYPSSLFQPQTDGFTGFNVFALILWTTMYIFKSLYSWISASCPLVSGEHASVETCEGTENLRRMRLSPWDGDKSLSQKTTSRWKAGMEGFIPQGSGTKEPIQLWHHSGLSLGWGLGYLRLSLTQTIFIKPLGVKNISRNCTFSMYYHSFQE